MKSMKWRMSRYTRYTHYIKYNGSNRYNWYTLFKNVLEIDMYLKYLVKTLYIQTKNEKIISKQKLWLKFFRHCLLKTFLIKKNKIVSHKYSSKMIDKLKKVASGKKMISPFSYTVSFRISNTIFQEEFIVLIQQINDDIE